MESLVSAEILATADTRQAAVRGRSEQRRRGRPRRLPARLLARSLTLAAVGVLVVALLPGAALAIPARTQTPPAQPADGPASGDWTQFHNGPAHLGTNSAETGISASNVDALEIAWTATTGGEIFSSPAVANGVIYVGSRDHKLYAFAAGCATSGGSCAPLWTATTGGEIWSSPAVANGVVYVGSLDHKLYAFDAAGVTGCSGGLKVCTPLWTAATGDAISAPPTVANGVVYVGSFDHSLYAFDAAGVTGCSGTPKVCTPLWTAATGAAIGYAAPTVAGGVVYVGSSDHKLYAFDAAGVTGCSGTPKVCTPLWTATAGGALGYSSPAVTDSEVYVGSFDGKLYAYAVGCSSGGGTCTPVWTATTGSYIDSSPAVSNGVVYVGSEDHKLYAFDTSGNLIWSGNTGGALEYSSPAVANGVVYVGSTNDKLYAYAVGCASGGGTCSPLWTGVTGGYIESAPAVSNGVVYVGSGDEKLYAFAITGDWTQDENGPSHQADNTHETVISAANVGALGLAWTSTVNGGFAPSPAIANGIVYATSFDDKLYAYPVGCNTGGGVCNPIWTAVTGSYINSTPAVANGVVYVASYDHKLYAFDAAGVTGCSGSPKICTPLWTAAVGDSLEDGLTVANGVVYVGSDDHKLYAFDAAGATGCSGDPKTCTALWMASAGGSYFTEPTVANGVVYVGSLDGHVSAFAVGCASGGGTCTPLWTAATNGAAAVGSPPAVADGVVFVSGWDNVLYAFAVGCASGGGTCTPLWTTATSNAGYASTPGGAKPAGTTGGPVGFGNLAVANGVVYVGSADDDKLYAFDATGVTGCIGSPKVCSPLWSGGTGGSSAGSPSVANGVVYIGSWSNTVYAFGVGCASGGGSCTPLWSASTGAEATGPLAIANGVLYVGAFNVGDTITGNLYAFALEAGVYNFATTYHSVTPGRVLDTRPTGAGHTNIGLANPFVAGTVRTFAVAGAPYVGGGRLARVPGNATAVTGNLTVVGATAGGVIALGPTVAATGQTTTIDFAQGETRANGVTIGLSPTGKLSAVFRSSTAGATTQLIFDATGYFTPGRSGATYHPVAPGRVLDTRKSGSGHTNIGLSNKFATGTVRTLKVAGVKGLGWSSAVVPAAATAVTGNLTVTNASSVGYVSMGQTMTATPSTSTLNVVAGSNIANGVTVALSGGTLAAVWKGSAGSSADLIFDVTGYFTADLSGLAFHPIVPERDLETATNLGLHGAFASGTSRTLAIGGLAQVPSGAAGISGNLTVLNPSSNGFASISPTTVANPTSSTINVTAHLAGANGFDVALASGGVAIVWVGATGSTADVALDVTGYWK